MADGKHRPFKPHGSTTWVKYVTFRFQPAVDPGLQEFLSDCHNVEQIICQYTADPVGFGYAAKLPLPLGRKQAFLFNAAESAAFDAFLDYFRTALSGVEPSKRFAAFAGAFQGAPAAALPMPVLLRIDRFLEEGGTGLLYPLSVSAESPVTTNQSTSSHDRRSD